MAKSTAPKGGPGPLGGSKPRAQRSTSMGSPRPSTPRKPSAGNRAGQAPRSVAAGGRVTGGGSLRPPSIRVTSKKTSPKRPRAVPKVKRPQ